MQTNAVLRILRIAHDTSIRGEGISLREALERSCYRQLRAQMVPSDLIPVMEEHPELIDQWVRYCEDKRTSGGYALESPTTAGVADYVLRELDYWDAVGLERRGNGYRFS